MILDRFSIRGRRALVTGASRGIGLAIAQALEQAGAEVTGLARTSCPFDRSIICDLSDVEELEAAIYGLEVDILVNAAGVDIRAMTEAAWTETLDLNLSAPFRLGLALAPGMRRRGWGRVLNISSVQAERAFSRGMAYGVSKAGLVQLTRAQAQAFAPVTCNAIAPGVVHTALTESVFQDLAFVETLSDRTVLGRVCEVEDLQGAAVFLCSDAASYITGQVLTIDGGFSIT